jgi:hypothetical protein
MSLRICRANLDHGLHRNSEEEACRVDGLGGVHYLPVGLVLQMAAVTTRMTKNSLIKVKVKQTFLQHYLIDRSFFQNTGLQYIPVW